MSTVLYAEIDGAHVPLSECYWVLTGPCGCPFGVAVTEYAGATEEQAWKVFYHLKRDIARAQRDGCRLELITCQRWKSEVADRMLSRRQHAEKCPEARAGMPAREARGGAG